MATTSTFSLRRLIQTKLNPDDDTIIEDTASAYEDDLRNPIKRRLAAWLIPDQPDHDPRRGSESAVDIRNVSEFLPTRSPAPPAPPILSDYSYNLPPHVLSDAADNTITGTNFMDSSTDANDGKPLPTLPGPSNMGSASTAQDNLYYQHDLNANHLYDQNLQQASAVTSGTRRLVRMPSFSSTFSSSSLDSDHHIPSQHHQDDQLVDESINSNDCRTLGEDAQESNQQSQMSMTFLFTPTPSHGSGPKDFMSLGPRDESSNMSSKRDSKEWSDGVRQLMLETEQAFASGSSFDGLSSTFELRLPNITEPKTPQYTAQQYTTEGEESEEDDEDANRPRETEDHEIKIGDQIDQENENVRRATFAPPTLAPEPESETTPPIAIAPTQPPTSSLLAPDAPPEVSISAPSPTTYQGPGPVVPLPQAIWRRSGEDLTAERRSMEQADEVPAPVSEPAEEDLDSEKRLSRSVPPPLPPRRKSLSVALEDTTLPKATSPSATSFNVTPAITNTQSPPAKVSQSSSRPPAKENNTSGQLALPKYGPSGPRRPSKITRWGLSEGVADILTGQRFKKIEADEMLTQEQLLKLKKEREEIRRKEEIESSRAAEVRRLAELERQVEKSSSENERSRSRNGWHKRNSGSSTSSTSSSYIQSHLSGERSPAPYKQRFSDDIGDLDDEMDEDSPSGLATVDLLGPSPRDSSAFQDGLPIPPPPTSQPPTAKLPPIPKGGSKKARKTKKGSKRQKPSNSLRPEENDEFFYLKSTPYSLALPSYRHGPIAFAKSEMGRGALTMDDTLDWTAFQMAILGAGDIMPEVYDDEDPRINEDVMAWFNSFGFDSHGYLVPESAPSPRSSSHSTISTAPTEASIPAPTIGESSSLWAYDTTQFFSSNGHKGWTMQSTPLESISHKRSDSTPPCSPMMPMVVGAEDDDEKIVVDAHQAFSGEKEVANSDVQMGCNMNSDLGDFLKWEAQHAFGPGYYGAH